MAEIKKDCFAYNTELHRCSALKELLCKVKSCPFYKKKRGGRRS